MKTVKDRYLRSLQHLPGVTEEIAVALYDAGYRTKVQIFAASDNDLKKIDGITTAKLNALKAYKTKVLAAQKPWPSGK